MMASTAQLSRDEVAGRGDALYERDVLPTRHPSDRGKFALIDVVSGDFEIDRDEIAASDRLLARHPEAQVWTRQVGSSCVRQIRSWMETNYLLPEPANAAPKAHRG